MPLAIGPQAVVCAPSRAACSVGPRAAAQLVRPRNSMHTRHCTLARAVVMKKKQRRDREDGGDAVQCRTLHDPKVGTAPNLSTTNPSGWGRPALAVPGPVALRQRLATFFRRSGDGSWNCCCSVEPSIAVPDDCPPVAIWV